MSVQDAVENDYRASPTQHTSEDLSSRAEPASSSRPVRAEPTTAVHIASTTGSGPHVSVRSVTPMSTPFDAFERIFSHSTQRMCSLESSCVHGENHGKRERQTVRVGVVT